MSETRPSWVMRLLAVLVFAIAAWVVIKVIIGIVASIAWIVVAVVAVAGLVWAYNTLSR